MLKLTSEAFVAGDINGDGVLTLDEFTAVVPASLRTADGIGAVRHCEDTIKEIFEECDADGNGSISRDEFLYWALRWVAFDSGSRSAFKYAFNKFDASGDQQLNLAEFAKAVEVSERAGSHRSPHPLLLERHCIAFLSRSWFTLLHMFLRGPDSRMGIRTWRTTYSLSSTSMAQAPSIMGS
jgi:Ca2+-binding EF-hand superfamily protein